MIQTLRMPFIGINKLILKRVRMAESQQCTREELATRRVPPFGERLVVQDLKQRNELITVLQCLRLLVSKLRFSQATSFLTTRPSLDERTRLVSLERHNFRAQNLLVHATPKNGKVYMALR